MRPILCAAALLAATTAHAQMPCGPTGDMLKTADKLGLEPMYGGPSIVPPGAGVLFVNPEDGHWLMLLLQGEKACILAEGRDGQAAERGRGV